MELAQESSAAARIGFGTSRLSAADDAAFIDVLGRCPQRASERLSPSFTALQPVPRKAARAACTPAVRHEAGVQELHPDFH